MSFTFRMGAVAAVATSLALSACAGEATNGGGGSAGSASPTVKNSIPSGVPDQVRASGTLRIAVNPAYPPLIYFAPDGKTTTGVLPDLMTSVAANVGLKVQFVETPFPAMLPGIEAGRTESALFFQDTAKREAVVNILALTRSTLQFVTPKDASDEAPKCGSQVGVTTSSIASIFIETYSQEQCVSKGQPPFKVTPYPNSDEIFLALNSGRIPAILTGSDNATYRAKQMGTIKLVGPELAPGFNGLAISKAAPDLPEVLRTSLADVMANGTYEDILKKYNMPNLALKEAVVNAATK